MEKKRARITEIITNLNATSPDDLELFYQLLRAAQTIQRRNQPDIGLSNRLNSVVGFGSSVETPLDVIEFIRLIPDQVLRYFHGLVEALEIYQSIHQKPLPTQIEPTDSIVGELRKIREYCILEGLHSIY